MKIITASSIAQSDWHHLTQWKERVFPDEGRGMEWSPVSWHSIAYTANEEPIGHIGFDTFEVIVDGNSLSLIGIGGVVVRPEYQGLGIPGLLFEEVHRQAPKKFNTDLFTLFCPLRLVTYYERHGYQRHLGTVHFKQYDKIVLSSFDFMFRGEMKPEGVVEIQTPPW